MKDNENVNSADETPADQAAVAGSAVLPAKSSMSKSMHDGVEVWCDCCSCEAEPYWIEAMRENGEEG